MRRRWVPHSKSTPSSSLRKLKILQGGTFEMMWERQWMPHSRSTLSPSARSVLRGPPGGILALKVLGETHQVMRRLTALLCGCSSLEVVKCGVERRSGHVGMVARCSVTVSGPLAAGPADTADLAGAARVRCSETRFS